QVVGAIRAEVAPDRIRADPVADPVVPAAIPKERPVRGLVHEDGEAELAGADDEERHDDGERVRGDRDQRERRRDEPPVDRDRDPGARVMHDEELLDLLSRERLAPGRTGGDRHRPDRTRRRGSIPDPGPVLGEAPPYRAHPAVSTLAKVCTASPTEQASTAFRGD